MNYDDNLFDVTTEGVQAMGGYELFPSGMYPAIMASAQRKATKNGGGSYLECTYAITDGEFAGKKYISRMNLQNANPQTVEIAKRELKSLRLALGYPDNETRTEMFLNRPLVLNLTLKNRKDERGRPTEQLENQLASIEPAGAAPQGGYGHAPAAPAAPGAPPAGWAPQPAPQGYQPPPQPMAPPQPQYAPPPPQAQPQYQQPQPQPQPQYQPPPAPAVPQHPAAGGAGGRPWAR